jgi:hypothetical protein
MVFYGYRRHSLAREKRHGILVVKDAIIADGNPAGISAEVLKNTFGATEGRFAIDDPLLFIELFSEDLEVAWLLEMTDTARENKITSFKQCLRWSRNLPLNNVYVTLTWMKNLLRHDTQRSPSEDSPPPVTMQWT